MRKSSFGKHYLLLGLLSFAFLLGLVGNSPPSGAHAPPVPSQVENLQGMPIDLVCYLNDREASFRSEHRECARKCLEAGLPAVLLNKKTGEINILVGKKATSIKEKILPFLYQEVTVKGRSVGNGGVKAFEVETVEKVSETQPQVEHVHNHTSFDGGQVGMSGDFHIEFVAGEQGEYRLYVTDFLRKPVDITNATGTLVINSDNPESEELPLKVDKVLQEFLLARGKPRLDREIIMASAKIIIPGKQPIFIEFQEEVGKDWRNQQEHSHH